MELDLSVQYDRYTVDELQQILNNPIRYSPEVLAAVRAALEEKLNPPVAGNDNFLDDLLPAEENKGMARWLMIAIAGSLLLISMKSYNFLGTIDWSGPSRRSLLFLLLDGSVILFQVMTVFLLFRKSAWGWVLQISTAFVVVVPMAVNYLSYFAGGGSFGHWRSEMYTISLGAWWLLQSIIFLRPAGMEYFRIKLLHIVIAALIVLAVIGLIFMSR